MIFGYARVSTRDQKLDLQVDALRKFGCDHIFEEKASGARKDRPVLDHVLSLLREGDQIVVWKLDRLGRNTLHLLQTIYGLHERGIRVAGVADNIDSTTATGRMLIGLFSTLAQWEREFDLERTDPGLKAARDRNRLGGRPPGLSAESEKTAMAVQHLAATGQFSPREIMKRLQIGKTSYYKYVNWKP